MYWTQTVAYDDAQNLLHILVMNCNCCHNGALRYRFSQSHYRDAMEEKLPYKLASCHSDEPIWTIWAKATMVFWLLCVTQVLHGAINQSDNCIVLKYGKHTNVLARSQRLRNLRFKDIDIFISREPHSGTLRSKGLGVDMSYSPSATPDEFGCWSGSQLYFQLLVNLLIWLFLLSLCNYWLCFGSE